MPFRRRGQKAVVLRRTVGGELLVEPVTVVVCDPYRRAGGPLAGACIQATSAHHDRTRTGVSNEADLAVLPADEQVVPHLRIDAAFQSGEGYLACYTDRQDVDQRGESNWHAVVAVLPYRAGACDVATLRLLDVGVGVASFRGGHDQRVNGRVRQALRPGLPQ